MGRHLTLVHRGGHRHARHIRFEPDLMRVSRTQPRIAVSTRAMPVNRCPAERCTVNAPPLGADPRQSPQAYSNHVRQCCERARRHEQSISAAWLGDRRRIRHHPDQRHRVGRGAARCAPRRSRFWDATPADNVISSPPTAVWVAAADAGRMGDCSDVTHGGGEDRGHSARRVISYQPTTAEYCERCDAVPMSAPVESGDNDFHIHPAGPTSNWQPTWVWVGATRMRWPGLETPHSARPRRRGQLSSLGFAALDADPDGFAAPNS